MALKTKIKLTPNYDWKSILLEDITGTGITGYGNNQDPSTYRDILDIFEVKISLTSPSNITTDIVLTNTGVEISNLMSIGHTISNTVLGYNVDEPIEEGIWKIKYVPFFYTILGGQFVIDENTFKVTDSLDTFPFNHTKNATELLFLTDAVHTYSTILNRVVTSDSCIITGETDLNGVNLTDGYIGIGTTLYTSITKELKECLDNKIADGSLMPCDCGDCSLMQKYLLYEAIELNCKQGNYTKANQIFTYLSELSTNCGC